VREANCQELVARNFSVGFFYVGQVAFLAEDHDFNANLCCIGDADP
jgi:hypothetical protein